MKVHFGGSSLGFRNHSKIYKQINDTIKGLGHSISHEWVHDTKAGDNGLFAKFRGTLRGIMDADAVILERTDPTLEVGQQYHMALDRNLAVLFLFHDEKANYVPPKSAEEYAFTNFLIDPRNSESVYFADYSLSTLPKILEDYFKQVELHHRTAKFNLVLEKSLDNYLRDLAEKHKTSKSEEIRNLIIRDRKNKKL